MGLAPNRSTAFAGDSATCEVPAPISSQPLSVDGENVSSGNRRRVVRGTLSGETTPQLFSMNGNLTGRIDANAYATSLDLQNFKRDGFAIKIDDNSLVAFPGED